MGIVGDQWPRFITRQESGPFPVNETAMQEKPDKQKSIEKSGVSGPVVAICGGVGGAKLALGLYRILEPNALSLIINTGDDFEHLGLHISPDIDTVTYTLAELNNQKTGWGRRDETWTFMKSLEALNAETWFMLGDGDLATHVERSRRLAKGESLSAITSSFAESLGISANLLPMTDCKLRTLVKTNQGLLSFQDYFVRQQAQPCVEQIVFDGMGSASPSEQVLAALSQPGLGAIVICPSNPFLSIDPILSVPGIKQAINASHAPVVGISPLIGGQAVKGPTAKIMAELSISTTASAIADHYSDLIDGLIIDCADSDESVDIPVPTLITPTLMKTPEDREVLAMAALNFASSLRDCKHKGDEIVRP
jgi:LPPG:FO 2-phospho-L-lactate transferase